MLYKTVKNEDSYEVLETQTYHVVAKGLHEHEAKKLCKNLNYGGGFDGFTPDFFMQDFKVDMTNAN